MFVMLCSQDVSWELMMAAYNARRLTEQAFDSEKERDDRLRSGDSVTVEGRYLIQFVSQIMLAEIRAVVREKDLADRYPVQSLLATLSTLNVLEYGGRRGLSEITKNVRRILEVFDLGVPSAPLSIMRTCSTCPSCSTLWRRATTSMVEGLGNAVRASLCDYRTPQNIGIN
jgi:hypothetical protein